MASVAQGLFSSLPKPKYTGENEELPAHAQPKGPRIVGTGVLDESQILVRVGSWFWFDMISAKLELTLSSSTSDLVHLLTGQG